MLRGTWDPPGPGIEPVSPALAGGFFTTEPPGKPPDTLLSISFGGAWIQRWVVFSTIIYKTSWPFTNVYPMTSSAKLLFCNAFTHWMELLLIDPKAMLDHY